MKSTHVTDFLVDYLDGSLEPHSEAEVKDHLANCGSCAAELEDLRKLLGAFEREEKILPTSGLQKGFDEMLEKEMALDNKGVVQISDTRSKMSFTTNDFFRIAAGVALLLGSFLLGQSWQSQNFEKEIAALQNETLEMKQTAMFSLMENKSASRRIQGVSYAEELPSLDPEIIEALIDRMSSDDNFNVRLAALEALGSFTDSEIVKDALIAALKTEQDPNLQIQIIQLLADIQEKKAVPPMQQLLENESTEPYVKEHIKSLLPTII